MQSTERVRSPLMGSVKMETGAGGVSFTVQEENPSAEWQEEGINLLLMERQEYMDSNDAGEHSLTPFESLPLSDILDKVPTLYRAED